MGGCEQLEGKNSHSVGMSVNFLVCYGCLQQRLVAGGSDKQTSSLLRGHVSAHIWFRLEPLTTIIAVVQSGDVDAWAVRTGWQPRGAAHVVKRAKPQLVLLGLPGPACFSPWAFEQRCPKSMA